ncbi:hypothetical protein CPB86DRAFT_787033 [Serendipita vermifera]|nr:hypothetical protein CPB86DRAFT_787033 [Serendipita vermifera]
MNMIMSRVKRPEDVAAFFDIMGSIEVGYVVWLGCLLAHREKTGEIIQNIYLKWDFGNNCPFPSGMKRKVGN